MPTALAPLTDFRLWARSNLLEIILLILGAVLLARLVAWTRDLLVARIDAAATSSDELVRSEAAKHRHAMAQVITWSAIALIYAVTVLLVIQRLGVPLASLVGPATLGGVALGFGAQRIVQDISAGFFIITERQYGFGDLVRLSVVGVPAPMTGTVEDVTLRITRIRTVNGEVVITPNGQIVQVTNLSRDWARAVIDVPVPAAVDVSQVSEVLHRVSEQAYADENLRRLLLDTPTVIGVESLDVDTIVVRLVARTQPGRQFDVGRDLRARIAAALRRAGVNVPAELEVAPASGSSA